MRYIQARHFTAAKRTEVDLVVIHDMEYPERPGAAEWCAKFFAGPSAPKASAHYCVDNDSIVQCVRERDVAWHAPGANKRGIGIEHAGYARQTAAQWQDEYSHAMLELSAELTANICHRHNIPVQRPTVPELKAGARGIIGHNDATEAWRDGKGHWDPGPHFPWGWYLERVSAHLALIRGDITDVSRFPVVEHDGQRWAVSPVYVPFVGIGQAEEVSQRLGCELPSPGLVDAIWEAADIKLDATRLIRIHDGTPATMASKQTFDEQAERIAALVGDRTNHSTDWQLQAGAFKDVVRAPGGKLGLYGWHRLDGTVIQPLYTGHARGWVDYSQGLRLCRRVP